MGLQEMNIHRKRIRRLNGKRQTSIEALSSVAEESFGR